MSKYTQGPWIAKKTAMKDTYWILSPKGGMVAKTELNPADAKLVAAAPELLSMVKYCLGVTKAFPDSFKTTPEFREELESLIAKAEK